MKNKIILLLSLAILLTSCNINNEIKLDKKNPVTIEVWHYYNSIQKSNFDQLVEEFNETVGTEKGIIVEAFSHGNISELTTSIINSANNKVGSSPIPNIFAAYADTADQIDKLGLVASLENYMTPEEIAQYVPAYIEEGRLGADGHFKIFPTAKSTEILIVNSTDWNKFASQTGANTDSLATFEGIAKVSEQYYNWTDAQTPDILEDGKAFFCRDAMANYFIIGTKQLGVEIFCVDAEGKVTFQIEDEIMRKLWDNYYVPYISGYFMKNGKFSSDDAKIGDVICIIGSTASATFFPSSVIINDSISYPIEPLILPAPHFEGAEPYAVQQGAGMVVSKGTPQTEYASTIFLKWFTEAERNIAFSTMSCYLPVKSEANDAARLEKAMDELQSGVLTPIMRDAIVTSTETVRQGKLYTNKAFEEGTKARSILEYSLGDKATADYKEIREMIALGISKEDAIAKFNTEEAFESWVLSVKDELNATQKGK